MIYNTQISRGVHWISLPGILEVRPDHPIINRPPGILQDRRGQAPRYISVFTEGEGIGTTGYCSAPYRTGAGGWIGNGVTGRT